MRSGTTRARRQRVVLLSVALLAALGAAQGALAQVPEASVVMYRVWNPGGLSNPNDGQWQWDQGIQSTDVPYYFDHDRGADAVLDPADNSRVWSYRWGDQVQVVVELSLPIYFNPAHLAIYPMNRAVFPTASPMSLNSIDRFDEFGIIDPPLPAGSTVTAIWAPIRVFGTGPGGPLTGGIAYFGPPAASGWATADPNGDGRIDGIDWTDPMAGGTSLLVDLDGPGPGAPVVANGLGDVEPGSGLPVDVGGTLYEVAELYTVQVDVAAAGDVLYPNPRTVGDAGMASLIAPASSVDAVTDPILATNWDPRLNLDNLVVDWTRETGPGGIPNQRLNDALTGLPAADLINPNFVTPYDPGNGMTPRQITTAAIELVGPDLDPLTPGLQAPRWTITNGRLAARARARDIGANSDLASAWTDWDSVPTVRWDERTTGGVAQPPDTPPADGTWKRIVRLVFGGTGYPGSRGSTQQVTGPGLPGAGVPAAREGRYQTVDDPDAFVIGPQAGMRYASTEAWRYDMGAPGATAWSIFGLLLGDRQYARDPFPANAGVPVQDTWSQGAKLDNPFVPGFWKVANVTLTVSPDPATPGDPNSFATIVVPVQPRAPWAVPDPTNIAVALPEEQKALSWFAVENPLDLQVARRDEAAPVVPTAADIGAGRFGFVGNPGSHSIQRPDAADAGALAGDSTHRYYLAQGNRDFPSLLSSAAAPASWDARYWLGGGMRWLVEDWDGDGSTATSGAALPGWVPPILDLGSGSPGQSVGWARTGDNRPNDGLWLSNISHTNLYRSVQKALEQLSPDDPTPPPATFTVTAGSELQDDGPGAVRIEIPPLRPIVTVTSDNWSDPNPATQTDTADARDYQGRTLPNGAIPSIPGSALHFTARGRDLSVDGLPTLAWARSDAGRTTPVSAETHWSAYDDRNVLTTTRGKQDTVAPERVGIVLDIPVHQPAMAGSDDGDWMVPTAPLEIVHDPANANYSPIGYYATLDPDDPNLPDWSGPGATRTDHQAGTDTLTYPAPPAAAGTATRPSEEDYMVKVYVDVNGNGKLDLPRVDLADQARTAGDRFWYRYLYAEPYRGVAVRAKVLPSYELGASRRVVDFGIYGHADPRGMFPAGAPAPPSIPWSGLPAWDDLSTHERDLGLTSRGNFPLGVFGAADGTPGMAEIGLTARSALGWPAWHTDEAEQGVCVPIERLMPNYLLETDTATGDPTWNPDTTGWSFLPAPAGAPADAGKPYIDGMTAAGKNGQPDPGEEVGSRAVADILGAGTPLGTYWLRAFTYMDIDGLAGFDSTIDKAYGDPVLCKATVKESPLPPLDPQLSREDGKNADLGAVSGPDNANTTFGELGPAFLVNTWDQDANGVPNVLGNGRYGDTATFFTSNRPGSGVAAGPDEGLPWRIWGQRYDWNFDPDDTTPMDQYRPIQPTFEPVDEAYLVADDPTGAPGVEPPDPRFNTIASYRCYPPAITSARIIGGMMLSVLTWTLEVDWAETVVAPAVPETRKAYYIGGAAIDTSAANMGQVLAGPVYIRSDAGAKFGPRPVIMPRAGNPAIYDLYVFYYLGSGNQRRLGYMRWDLGLLPPSLTYVGSHELPIMTRYGPGTIRLDGLEYAKDVAVFQDAWCDVDAAGGPVWHRPNSDPTIGVVFAGRSRTFQTQDIFYTRFDPTYPAGAPLSDPASYDPTNNNTGQVPFPERHADLVPLRQEALTAGQASPDRQFAAYTSAEWVDWVYDVDGGVGITVGINGGPSWGPLDWVEDPVSGYLYARNADGGRVVEVDPTVGLVRFVDEELIPTRDQVVYADFTPQTMRVTRASQDSGQPTVVILQDEEIQIPFQPAPIDASVTVTPAPVRQPVGLPLRMVVLYKRFDTQGRTRLLYETLSMPYTYPGAPAPPAGIEQIYWTKVTNPDPDALGLPPGSDPYPIISYPIATDNTGGLTTQEIPFYVDRNATQTPLEETVGELYVSAQPVRYTWFTDVRNVDPVNGPPYLALGPTLAGIDGPAATQTLQQVAGPAVVWFMFSSTAEKEVNLIAPSGPLTPSEDWGAGSWGIFGAGDQAAFGYDADWDQYFAVLSPQAIPRTVVHLAGDTP